MDGGTALGRILTVGERSFKREIKKLLLGEGDTFHGEGILAITKALLQSGISYVGGYPGAPMSHLTDVLADASKEILEPMGIHYEQSSYGQAVHSALLRAMYGAWSPMTLSSETGHPSQEPEQASALVRW